MKDTKPLILALIKDDLINTKLIAGLSGLGLDSGLYLLGLSDTIFVLMGIDNTQQGEDLFEHYLELREKVESINLSQSYEALDALALEIYEALMAKKGK